MRELIMNTIRGAIKVDALLDPVYAALDKSSIDVNVRLATGEIIPFAASRNDPEPHGRLIYDALVSGESGTIADYVKPPESEPVVQRPPRVIAP